MQEMQNLTRKTRRMNKKGQVFNIATNAVMGVVGLIIMVVVGLFTINVLNPGSFFTAGSSERNSTNQLVTNFTDGVASVGKYIPTTFLLLGALLAIGAIVIFVIYARRIQQVGGSGGGL